MEREWTASQKKVIENRNKNLLVSAAAGSGKTTVLVERIIRMITDPENPVDIDKLVVITFTRAAAAQMRQKISDELEKLIEKEPENTLYRRQQRLVGNAQICTIDSFCINIVRSYFQKLELDPAFRIADETELKLIKSECMDELMERCHEEGSEDYYYLLEAYCNYKSDEKLTEYIYTLANRAEALAWPDKWLDSLEKDFDIKDGEELSNSKPAQSIYLHVKDMLKGMLSKIGKAEKLCTEDDGAPDYLLAIKSDRAGIESALEASNYKELGEKLNSFVFEAFSRKKTGTAEIKDKVKKIRDVYKKDIESIKKSFFPGNTDETASLIRKSLPAVRCLIKMTKDYMTILEEKKKEKNVIDFSDAEHFALNILWGDTPEALELRKQYHEIIIDEYQDSNNVQEYIANSIAGNPSARPFVFTVGDVKQSIYKFRNACPELFIEKQKIYGENKDNGELIILDNNFRSREEVLDSTNAVFKHIMREELGGIDYNDECSLKKGCDLQNSSGPDSPYKTEVLLITDEPDETESEDGASENFEDGESGIALEARLVAKRIKKLIYKDGLTLTDEENKGSVRPVRFSDIVILLRTIKGWASVYAEVFEEEGIPVFSEDAEGFFKSPEVRLVIDFLSILDNPRQDIPFAAVLHSIIAGLDEEELALIRIYAGKTETFYEAALTVAENSELIKSGKNPNGQPETGARSNPKLKTAAEKLKAFFELYNKLQEQRHYSSVAELIESIYSNTNLYYYYSALPDGEKRKANLDMLPGYAVNYENTSYSGLFSFIRYYEKLKNNELDYGEAGARVTGNCVRIMSIHKSKGLEFPVVFVSGMGKEFNLRDFGGDICINSQHGLGIKYVDIENRTKYPSFYHSVIAMRGREDVIGEEMRLLYVAMTRAKDKIIMTGHVKKPNESTDYASLFKAKCFMDFVYPVLNAEAEFFNTEEVSAGSIGKYGELPENVPGAGFDSPVKEEDKSETGRDRYEDFKGKEHDEIRNRILKIRSAEYPYSRDETVPVKLSVSEIKRMMAEEDYTENLYDEPKEFDASQKTIPDFLKKDGAVTAGTDYGTLVHKCMRFIPMRLRDKDGVEGFFTEMVNGKKITPDEKERLSAGRFAEFLNSPIAERIRKADEKGSFYREKQFMLAIPAETINSEKYKGSRTLIPVQGVIDAMFEEDGELVILDYKTDSLKPGEEEKLAALYGVQLDIYAMAAEKLLKKPVKERLLYSFSVGKTISICGGK